MIYCDIKYYRPFMTNKLVMLEKKHGDYFLDKNKLNVLKELQKLIDKLYKSQNITNNWGNGNQLESFASMCKYAHINVWCYYFWSKGHKSWNMSPK